MGNAKNTSHSFSGEPTPIYTPLSSAPLYYHHHNSKQRRTFLGDHIIALNRRMNRKRNEKLLGSSRRSAMSKAMMTIAMLMLLSITALLNVLNPLKHYRDDRGSSKKTSERKVHNYNPDFSWMNTSGIVLSLVEGDPDACTDVIYTADTRLPHARNKTYIDASWDSLSIISRLPLFNKTCFAFFHISDEHYQPDVGLHPVWGRIPATALAVKTFPKADVMLYMDTDAILASPRYTPSAMYDMLRYDVHGHGHSTNTTLKQLRPSLIANKPMPGWLCGECEKFGLGHGCFNSGALLWHKSAGMELILKAWWESRLDNITQNIFREEAAADIDEDEAAFHGWSAPTILNHGYKMSEQNRLMYIYHSNPAVRSRILPVPRQPSSVGFNSASCPNTIDVNNTPCLQSDRATYETWDSPDPSCFINHFCMTEKTKETVHAVLDLIVVGKNGNITA
jgi:hypothetical protein